MTSPLLAVDSLEVSFPSPAGWLHAVRGVSFAVDPGETLGIVGESGCGKSVTALTILGLVPCPPGRVDGRAVSFEGENLLTASPARLRAIRGNRIAMIFQEPMTSLNPVFTIGEQLAEPLTEHLGASRAEAMARATRMLDKVGIPAAARRMRDYPHQLSGGMRQRVMIAMALACNPRVLLADEPTTALDVTIQAQIVELLLGLQDEFGTSIVLISHDLGLIAETCDRIAVMYAGRIVEEAGVRDLFALPLHPYTQGLLGSIPRLRTDRATPRTGRLATIAGTVPNLARLPRGCAFQPRCPHATAPCIGADPPLAAADGSRRVACWLHVDAQRTVAAAVP